MIKCDLEDDRFATKGDTCTFTCDDGFELHGIDTRKCWVRWGRTWWTGYEAACKKGNTFPNEYVHSTYVVYGV